MPHKQALILLVSPTTSVTYNNEDRSTIYIYFLHFRYKQKRTTTQAKVARLAIMGPRMVQSKIKKHQKKKFENKYENGYPLPSLSGTRNVTSGSDSPITTEVDATVAAATVAMEVLLPATDAINEPVVV